MRDFSVTASLTVIYRYFSANREEDSKVFRNCIDASAMFTSYTRTLNPNFSGCRNWILDFDIPALDLTSFEWTYMLPYARINFPFVLPSICLRDVGKTKLIREATHEGHISCRLRGMTIRKRGMFSQYSRCSLGSFFGAWGLPPGEHNTKAAEPRASERSWRAEVHRRTAAICTVTQGV